MEKKSGIKNRYQRLVSKVVLLCLLLTTQHVSSQDGVFVSSDGNSYYTTAVTCATGGSLLTDSYYEVLQRDYTLNNLNCCFRATSRNQCCTRFQSRYCFCDPSIQAGTCTTQPLTQSPTVSTSTTPITTTTTTPTITTTTTTTTTPTTTTTTPTTTTTTPTTTITTPTTTTTTTTTTTPPAPAPRSLCSSFRALGGTPVDNRCTAVGIAKISPAPANPTDAAGTLTACNAVYTQATVNGVRQNVFFTSSFCKNIIQAFQAANSGTGKPELIIGNIVREIEESELTIVDAAGGSGAYLVPVSRFQGSFDLSYGCSNPDYAACGYNPSTMPSVNLQDCSLKSFGTTDQATFTQQLAEVPMRLNAGGCSDVTDLSNAGGNNQCYTTISGNNVFCVGDAGAPIYCKSTTNNEDILVGVVAGQNSCNNSPNVWVVPFAG